MAFANAAMASVVSIFEGEHEPKRGMSPKAIQLHGLEREVVRPLKHPGRSLRAPDPTKLHRRSG
jgi:hypothetical protein